MRLIHISDLHIGKRIGNRNLLEDQMDILEKILGIIDEQGIGGVIMAGDIYDKAVPSAEAVECLDWFLNELAKKSLQVIICAGNHDSTERLSFGEKFFSGYGIHISPVYDGTVKYVDLNGTRVHILPFIKPIHVRNAYPDEADDIKDYTDAMKVAIEHMELLEGGKNILCCHQFVTGASRTESEEVTVGGLDNVDGAVFDCFDYVALGHIHRPQYVGENIRYCGTPLKYSFSEENDVKSVTVLDISDETRIETVELKPLHDMRTVKGTFEELNQRNSYENTDVEDYVRVILTDENDIPDAMGRMRKIYPNILALKYDNARTRAMTVAERTETGEKKSPMDYLKEFFKIQNGRPMDDEQERTAAMAIEAIWGEEEVL